MSTPPVAALYQERILDHSRNPRRFGPLPDATHRAQRDNPFCGDAITVAVVRAADQIADVRFEGAGCAIALASASMMAEAVAGRSLAEAAALADRFCRFVGGEPGAELGPLEAFAVVAQFPVRVECARLPWLALLAAID
jgi:nitrogen fixation protein NifU and related proteins